VELVAEVEHIGHFLVGKKVTGDELPLALNAVRHRVAGRWKASHIFQ